VPLFSWVSSFGWSTFPSIQDFKRLVQINGIRGSTTIVAPHQVWQGPYWAVRTQNHIPINQLSLQLLTCERGSAKAVDKKQGYIDRQIKKVQTANSLSSQN
jgi:hypothetical protein